MSTHTPGPWTIQANGVIRGEATGLFVIDKPESESDAKLIARAPTMAELLQDLVAYHNGSFKKHSDLHALVSKVRRELEVAGL